MKQLSREADAAPCGQRMTLDEVEGAEDDALDEVRSRGDDHLGDERVGIQAATAGLQQDPRTAEQKEP